MDRDLANRLQLAAAQRDSATANESAALCSKQLVAASKAAQEASLKWDADLIIGVVLAILQVLSMLRGLVIAFCISRGCPIPKWIFLPEW